MMDAPVKYVNQSQLQPIFIDEPIKKCKNVSIKTGRIYLVTITANISAIAIGTCFSWSSPVGPKLTSPNTSDSPLDRPISPTENAWISSIFTIGALMTSLISGLLADILGRKRILLFSSLFFILGYTFLLIAQEVWLLIVGRLTLGFGSGIALCVIPLYVTEISIDEVRGATISFMQFLISVGIIYGYCVGPFVSYTMLQYCCLLVPIVFDVVFIFMPESPYYSLAKGQRSAASNALQFLRGQDAQTVEAELRSIENLVTNSMTEKISTFEILKTPGSRRALLISLSLIFFQQISGQNVVVFYTQSILESVQISLDAAIATIMVACVQLAAASAAPIVVNNFGRKTLLLYSTVLMSVSLAALGYFFYSQLVLGNTNGISWLPVAALVLYHLAFILGIGPVPWAVLSEIFPPNTKSLAAALTTFLSWLTGFSAALFYPTMDALGTYYAFWLFAIFCFLAFFFVLFIVVETKGLSFAEIQSKLNKSL